MAEDAARELPNLPLEDALKRLERYLTEGTPRLRHFAEITTNLAKRDVNE